jgi:hypothetical protein
MANKTATDTFEKRTILVLRDDGELFVADAIDYEGKLWLVPEWIPGPEIRCERPTRLICLDDLQVIEADSRYQADLELVRPLPKSFLDGREVMEGVSVINRPDIFRRLDTE